jgi:hypothetical protein
MKLKTFTNYAVNFAVAIGVVGVSLIFGIGYADKYGIQDTSTFAIVTALILGVSSFISLKLLRPICEKLSFQLPYDSKMVADSLKPIVFVALVLIGISLEKHFIK